MNAYIVSLFDYMNIFIERPKLEIKSKYKNNESENECLKNEALLIMINSDKRCYSEKINNLKKLFNFVQNSGQNNF